MSTKPEPTLSAELAALRLELESRGWEFERQGSLAAADVALAASARLGELLAGHFGKTDTDSSP